MGTVRASLVFPCVVGTLLLSSAGFGANLEIWGNTTVQAGERYETVSVGGVMPPPFSFTVSPVVEFYGRAWSLVVNESSVVNIREGGLIQGGVESHLWDSSTVNVYEGGGFGGMSGEIVSLHDSSTLSVYGGDISRFVFADGASTINLHGGLLGPFGLGGNSTLNIYGGRTGTFLGNNGLADTATLNIFGSQFVYHPEWYPADEMSTAISRLDYVGLDGKANYLMGIPDPAMHSNIHLIPEPCTIALLAAGVLAVRRRKAA